MAGIAAEMPLFSGLNTLLLFCPRGYDFQQRKMRAAP
jgi:hypothetical protein|tara:strand:- start:46 stop:156 length:111 start_codon:yes stop_codon:yes gene_type:complete